MHRAGKSGKRRVVPLRVQILIPHSGEARSLPAASHSTWKINVLFDFNPHLSVDDLMSVEIHPVWQRGGAPVPARVRVESISRVGPERNRVMLRIVSMPIWGIGCLSSHLASRAAARSRRLKRVDAFVAANTGAYRAGFPRTVGDLSESIRPFPIG